MESTELYDKSLPDEEIDALIDKAFAEAAEKKPEATEEPEKAEEETEEETEETVEETEETEETETEAEESEEAEEEETPAPAEKPAEKPEEKKDAKLDKLMADLEELAKSQFYDSVEEMIADQKGISLEEYQKTLQPEAPKEESKGGDKDAVIKASEVDSREWEAVDPTAKGKNAFDLKNPDLYIAMRANGVSAAEAYKYVQGIHKAPASKAHLKGTAPARSVGGGHSIPADVMRSMRSLCPEMKDGEIAELYRRIHK